MSSITSPTAARHLSVFTSPSKSTWDPKVTILYDFSKDPFFKGWLTYDKVKQVQAYILNEQGSSVLAMFNSPFNRLTFKTVDEFNTFSTHVKDTYSVKVVKLGEKRFDVSLKLKLTKEQLALKLEGELGNAYMLNHLGVHDYRSRNFPRASTHLRDSIEIMERLAPNSLDLASSYEDLGAVYKAEKKLQDALESNLKGLAIREQQTPNLEAAECHVEIASIYHAQGDSPKALAHMQKSLEIYERLLPNSLKLAYCYSRCGVFFWNSNKFQEAHVHFQKSLEIHHQLLPGSSEEANCHESIGTTYQLQGDQEKAFEHFQTSFEILKRLDPNSLGLADYSNELGLFCFNENKLPEALGFFQKTLEIYERLSPGSFETANFYIQIGRVYEAQGMFPAALEQFEKGLMIHERLAPESLDTANSYSHICRMYHAQEKKPEALNNLQKSYAIYACQSAKNPKEVLHHLKKSLKIFDSLAVESLLVATMYKHVGTVFQRCGKRPEAIDYYKKSLLISEKLALDKLDTAKIHFKLGRLYQLAGSQFPMSLSHFQEGLAICEALDPQSAETAISYSYIGFLYKQQNKLAEALEQFQKGLAISEQIDSKSLETANYSEYIGGVLQTQGNLLDAYAYYQEAYDILESNSDSKLSKKLSLGITLARIALKLLDFETTLIHVEKVLENDPTYKYAHVAKGLALKGQGNFKASLEAFNQALALDSEYAEANEYRLEVMSELAKRE